MTFPVLPVKGYNTKLAAAEWNALFDGREEDAIDGGEGGTYTPSAPIIIAGSHGLKVTGRFETTSTPAFLTGGFLTAGASQFGGDVDLNAGYDFGVAFGSGFTIAGSTVYNSGATITVNTGTTTQINSGAAWTFQNTVTVNGSSAWTWSSTASATFATGTSLTVASGAALAINGASTLTAKMTASGVGRVTQRRVAAVNADHNSYGIDDGDYFDIPTQSANHTYTINLSDAVAGDTMTFSMASSATSVGTFGVILIRAADSTQIGPSLVKNTGGIVAMTIQFDGTKWQPLIWSPYDA